MLEIDNGFVRLTNAVKNRRKTHHTNTFSAACFFLMQIKRWLLSFNDEWHISKVQNSFVLQLFSWKLCNLRAISFDLAFCDKNLVDSNQSDIWYESKNFVSDNYIRLTFDLRFAIKNGWKNDDFFRTMWNGYSIWCFEELFLHKLINA